MNTRCCAVALLLALSGSAIAADTAGLPASNPAGIWLITFGIAFLIAEAALPNYGVIGLGGIVMFVIGAVILTNAELPVPLMIGLGLISALLLIFLLISALKTRQRHRRCRPAGQRYPGAGLAGRRCLPGLGTFAGRTLAGVEHHAIADRAKGPGGGTQGIVAGSGRG